MMSTHQLNTDNIVLIKNDLLFNRIEERNNYIKIKLCSDNIVENAIRESILNSDLLIYNDLVCNSSKTQEKEDILIVHKAMPGDIFGESYDLDSKAWESRSKKLLYYRVKVNSPAHKKLSNWKYLWNKGSIFQKEEVPNSGKDKSYRLFKFKKVYTSNE